MFGYVQIRKLELKIKDYEVYHGFYCGLCSVLKEEYGFLGQVTLTYDMTFLVMLLSSVYDVAPEKKKQRCMVHPARKHLRLVNAMSRYGAHLNMILTYYHLEDDRKDEGSKKAWLGTKMYQGKKKRAGKQFMRQEKAIETQLERLSAYEKEKEEDIDKVADCFGKLMEELFVYKEDALAGYLRQLGYHLGRFIYIMDAYDDLKKDRENGSYNPLIPISQKEDYTKVVENMLLEEMAEAAAAYEKLPCIAYKDILGNIIYAGVWNRFDAIQLENEKEKTQEDSVK